MGLSQRELSRRSGLTQSQISRIENGVVDMRMSSLLALTRMVNLELGFTRRSRAVPSVRWKESQKDRRQPPGETTIYGSADIPRRPGIFGDLAEELL